MVQHLTDRVSVESLSKFRPDDTSTHLSGYGELKSPVDQIQLEDGSLRPVNGSVSAYSWENLGMLTHIAAVGTVYGTVSGVIYSVLNNYLHMSTTLVATATALVTFPRALRIFTGMLTDTCPIFGYRRRPYMIIGWSLSFVSCLLMAALPLGDPYYGDASLSDIALVDMTPDQLATLNTDAPDRGVKLIILMMVTNFGSVMAYSGFNGALMDASQREPEATRGTLIGDVIVIHYVFMVVSAFMTGIGLNGEDYGGTFSWTMGFNAVMWVCAAASLLTIPFSWYCIQEVKNERAQMPILPFLYDVFQQEVIYRYSAFRFCFSVFSQITVTASSVIQSDWAKVEPLNSGIASMITAFLTISGTYLIKKRGLQWNWRYIIIVCEVSVVSSGVPLVGEVPFAAADYVAQLLILEIGNHKGFEATLLGLGVTTESVGTPFATVITKTVDGYFDIERTFIEQDNHFVRSQVTYTYLIAYAFNLLSIAAVFWLPKQKDEVHEMQRQNRKSKFWGIATMSYLIFSLAWTLMTNILSLFDSTSCLRIAGGNGC
ncbi:hypothetical protein PF005_g14367 [Phytophthora fragariae]|uniref:Major facilitator superfamily (MFS) profile domain-containing protein n=1 Tax=Phytophthora fragariae TaxID=53985 RepID=A0A6A3YK96_9STRA|nr:hypothetical protein PF003_g25998 [Phytophthora fragariae]KAE9001042.1 hypothetical protein PF011_g13918 [Phytophthora fragariae]KAE9202987.1 hypothetical protein PF005_g14367 [Phytophthora fragariae]KAE9220231.1 hypothetical protein PF002_g15949 [Phytophthora fragariae]